MNDEEKNELEELELSNNEELENTEIEETDDDSSETSFVDTFHERDSLIDNNIVTEVEQSFLDYSMSVIASRALPDVRDGLKPVHRRIIWTMFENGYTPDKQYRKCAKTVGDVMGNYHPHGDTSIYDAMVRMAQPFKQRTILVDGHGNFGNIDGDGAAAMRYTEARLSKISLELVRDIRKNTVDMVPNFDETAKEPTVLPSKFPNILVNGSEGIAVGMATNIPPHNLGEVIDGCVAYLDNPDITTDELMTYVKGPDFPTGAIILGNKGIRQAYETGRGSITIRSKAEIEEDGSHSNIVITEVPYGVNTNELKTKVAELVHNKTIEGISDYHTDLTNGIKITITLKKDVNAQVVLNNLYKHTNFQTSYGINLLVLDGLTPKTLGLKDIISKYLDHQREVIIRRTQFDLSEAEARMHILEGYRIALDHIDEVISIIRNSETDQDAKEELISKFKFTDIQANAILEFKLKRLTGLERSKIDAEFDDLTVKVADYKDILSSYERVSNIIKEELLEVKNKYSDERRTHIDMTAIDYIEDESLIPEENIMIALTEKGYIKRIVSDIFKSQHRGGVGVKGMSTNEDDEVKFLINCSTHDQILFFTDKGKTYRIKGYEVPVYSRQAKGLPIINLIQIDKDENINSIINIPKDTEYKYLIFATKRGIIKKTDIEAFSNIRNSGKIAINLKENDSLIDVRLSTGDNKVILGSSSGRMVIFTEDEVRPMSRTAAGVKGITLGDSECIGMEVGNDEDNLLVVTNKGYGKKTFVSEYRITRRGSKGVKALNTTEKNGNIVAHKIVNEENDLMIITTSGMTIRLPINQISQLGRVTQGVKLISLKDNQLVSSISIVDKEIEENLEDSDINNSTEESTEN